MKRLIAYKKWLKPTIGSLKKLQSIKYAAPLAVLLVGGGVSAAYVSSNHADQSQIKPAASQEAIKPAESSPVAQDTGSTTQPAQATSTNPSLTATPSDSSSTKTPTSATTTTSVPPKTLKEQYPDAYPSNWANAPLDSIIDTWGMDNRESVSYTAYKVNEAYNDMPKWGLTMSPADAKNWPTDAQTAGITTGTTAKVHSVAIRTTGATGFSAWVEAVNGDQITVSSYNADNKGDYDVQTVPASSFSTYIYFQ